jgi:hypothetical protein
MGRGRRRTVINELERRGAPDLAAAKVKQAIVAGRGNFRAIARVLQVKRRTAGKYVERYGLMDFLREQRALHSPHCALKEWWNDNALEEVNAIRAAHGLDPYFPVRWRYPVG